MNFKLFLAENSKFCLFKLQVEQWARDAKIHDNDRQLFSIDTLEPIIQAAALLQVSVQFIFSISLSKPFLINCHIENVWQEECLFKI